MAMRFLLLLAVSLTIASAATSATQAASFDCTRATTAVEKTICDQPDLSKADEQLAQTFASALAATLRPSALRGDQVRWLAERDKLATADKLREAYRSRTSELTALTEAWRKFVRNVPLDEAKTSCLVPPEAPSDTCTVEAFGAVPGSTTLRYQQQLYKDGTLRAGAGIIVFRDNGSLLTPVVAVAEDSAHYSAPRLLRSAAGSLLLVAGHLEGTGNFNAGALYLFEGATFAEIDTESWLADLQRQLPKGWGAWKGIYPDFETFTATTPLWQTGDGNCCPTAGKADIVLGLEGRRLVIRQLKVAKGADAAEKAR